MGYVVLAIVGAGITAMFATLLWMLLVTIADARREKLRRIKRFCRQARNRGEVIGRAREQRRLEARAMQLERMLAAAGRN